MKVYEYIILYIVCSSYTYESKRKIFYKEFDYIVKYIELIVMF